MSEQPASLRDVSNRVLSSARDTAFALMKANYVERDAWELPGGKIEGVAPEARDIAVRLRESIWARFHSLQFHHDLLVKAHEAHVRALRRRGPQPDNHDAIWNAIWHAQFLFDDLIFNAASLFDYLGNAVWFGFHGQNHIKKKWKKARQAAERPEIEEGLPNGRRIYGSRTGEVILEANRSYVDKLYDYRSDLIHNRMDGASGSVRHRLTQDEWEPELEVSLPEDYANRLHSLVPEVTQDGAPEIAVGAEHLVRKIGSTTLSVLAALRTDLDWSKDEPIAILS